VGGKVSEIKVEVRRMRLDDLKPADYNPRVISDEAFVGLGHSIDRFGMLSHIVWNKRSGNIVGGHQRCKHLMEAGEEDADVVVVDLDDNEEVALNITLNNRSIRGDFTKNVMEQLMRSEAQIGTAFKEIGLLNLFAELSDKGLDKKEKEKKKPKIPEEKAGKKARNSEAGLNDGKPDVSNQAVAVIVCPRCKSQWKLTDNKVVFNSVTGTGSPVGGE
jgi:hypothetical protein